MRAVLTPMHEAMGRFCVTPRTNRPKRVLPINSAMPTSTAAANTMINTRFQGNCRLGSNCSEPLIHEGFSTPTFCAPNKLRTPCISTRLMPQVASKVSKGRPYKCLSTVRSITAPTKAEVMNATGIATAK